MSDKQQGLNEGYFTYSYIANVFSGDIVTRRPPVQLVIYWVAPNDTTFYLLYSDPVFHSTDDIVHVDQFLPNHKVTQLF